MEIVKSKETQRWQGKALMGVVAVLLMVFGTITPASAAIHSGTKGCPGQFGYLKGTTVGATELAPPGSYWAYLWTTGGTRTRVAVDSAWNSKLNGGYWYVTGTISATGTPSCSAAG